MDKDYTCICETDDFKVYQNKYTDKDICIINKNNNENNWIPCSERLPEEHIHQFCGDGYYVEPSDMVLITTVNGNVTVSRYWGNRYSKISEEANGEPPAYYDWVDAELWEDDVIAWMPLPKPYKI